MIEIFLGLAYLLLALLAVVILFMWIEIDNLRSQHVQQEGRSFVMNEGKPRARMDSDHGSDRP